METNTITIELPAQLYNQLQTLAEDERTDLLDILDRLIKMAVKQRAQPTTCAFQRILERATDLGVDDLAENHDHYLYGIEKQ